MFKIILPLLLSTSLWAHGTNDYPDRYLQVEVKAPDRATINVLQTMGLDIAGVDKILGLADLIVSDSEFRQLQKRGFQLKTVMTRSIMRVDEEYKTSEEIADTLKVYHERFPEITKLEVIGYSGEKRPILALKISDNVDKRETEEPTILFNSMHHAREVMSPEIGLDIIEFLLTNYQANDKVKNWVNNNEIWVLPMLNVDGNNKVWNSDPWWRKNTTGGHGVDINRNYPYKWGSCNGSSDSKYSDTYRGESAGSEPETKTMMDFVSKIKPVFSISYHSYSELVIYPFGCEGSRTPNKEVVEGIGREIGKKVDYEPGTSWELLYSVDGGDIDWLYAAQQVIPYVLEVNSRSEGFQPDYKKWRDVTVTRNRAAWQFLLDRLDGSAVRGMSNPKSIISVFSNNKLLQTYAVNPDGTFHIVLTSGDYKLVFKKETEVYASKDVSVKNKRVELGAVL
jgi:hypothetical protein